MSQLTDYAENRLVDMIRAQAWALPSNLYMGLASTASDSAVTELTGTGYARVALIRNLSNWAGTQAPGSVTASTGTTHASSNNVVVDWGTSGSAWGTANFVVVYDASTAGNALAFLPLATPIVIGTAQPVSVAIGALNFTLGLTGGCSDYLANKLIDLIFRGQAFTFPATMYEALLTAAPGNAGGGTEVGGGVGYARVAVAGSLTSWAGTQAAGTTAASTGTSGQTSNNAVISFPAPTASWGTLGWQAEYDASIGGNLLFWSPLAASKTVPAGSSAPSFPAAARTITFA
jgi:hypothetical protein